MQNQLPLRHPCEGRDLSLIDEIPAFGLVDLTPENGFFNAPPTTQSAPDKNRFVPKH